MPRKDRWRLRRSANPYGKRSKQSDEATGSRTLARAAAGDRAPVSREGMRAVRREVGERTASGPRIVRGRRQIRPHRVQHARGVRRRRRRRLPVQRRDRRGVREGRPRDPGPARAERQNRPVIRNGSKTFISAGIYSDLVIVVARTEPEAGHKGFSLLVVERGMEGFTRGRKLDKMGLHAADTAELHFENVRVPGNNLLGQEGRGFYHLMHNLPSERLSIAIAAIAGARETWRETLQYVKDRKAFGQPIRSFQHNRFLMAEMDTELEIAEQYIDRCLRAAVGKALTAVQASKAKWWCTQPGKRVVDDCVQLHRGYGYMNEYKVPRDYVDVRILTNFGATTEIMKEIIGRDLGL